MPTPLSIAPASITLDEPRRRKVALVGTAPSSIHAPFDDPSWEIWGVGYRGKHVKRATRWYEIHNLALEKDGKEWQGPEYLEGWSHDCEVWMFFPDQMPQIKDRVRQFPIKFILDKRHDPRFLSSSFAWMLAHAYHAVELGEEAVDEVGLWGVDMEAGTEYEDQREGLFHWIELLHLAGIEVRRLVSSGIAYTPPPYPFSKDDPLAEKLLVKRRAIEAESRRIGQTVEELRAAISFARGAASVHEAAGNDAEAAKQRAIIKATENELGTSRLNHHECKGWIDCLTWLSRYLKA